MRIAALARAMFAFFVLSATARAQSETMRPSPNQEVINDTAKLIMHRLIARSLAQDSTLISRARVALAGMARSFPNRTFIREWDDILGLPPNQVVALLTSHDPEMRRLRLSSPFVTAEGVDFTGEDLRRRIRRAAKRIATRIECVARERLRETAA